METKTTTCPYCQTIVTVPFVNGEYDPCDVVCPNCSARGCGGNCFTGIVSSWITEADLERNEEIYRLQCIDADNNEWYGRGNW